MNQKQADMQLVLVVENPDYLAHAAAALASVGGADWVEVRDAQEAAEWLLSNHADIVLFLVRPTVLHSIPQLRQIWHGPLVCYCEPDEDTLRIVESVQGIVVLPPFSPRQVVSVLNFLGRLGKPFTSMTMEVTESRIQQTLRESERRLEQAQRMEAIGRLAGGIVHDFNNLLTVIGGYSDLALRKLEDGHVVARYVEQIRKANAIASNLTRQLLAFSRQQVLQPRVLNINELVDEISFMVQSLLGANIELDIRLESELGQIEADPAQIQQVLLNLIVNAKDAMADGGLLNIETRNFDLDESTISQIPAARPGSYVRLTVADTGIGIDQNTLERIFEPFFTTKPKGRGTGLGLPTVYGIVQQCNGHISVYSEVGRGTTFHIYLPRVDKKMEQVGDDSAFDLALAGNETILLLEDEAGVRELASTILQGAGYHLLHATTPEEAIQIEHEYAGSIDLLLTDIVMPQMTGRDVAQKLCERRPMTSVLYMSGYTEDVVVYQRLMEGDAYLVEKPFYPDQLLRMVRQAIDHPFGRELAKVHGRT